MKGSSWRESRSPLHTLKYRYKYCGTRLYQCGPGVALYLRLAILGRSGPWSPVPPDTMALPRCPTLSPCLHVLCSTISTKYLHLVHCELSPHHKTECGWDVPMLHKSQWIICTGASELGPGLSWMVLCWKVWDIIHCRLEIISHWSFAMFSLCLYFVEDLLF